VKQLSRALMNNDIGYGGFYEPMRALPVTKLEREKERKEQAAAYRKMIEEYKNPHFCRKTAKNDVFEPENAEKVQKTAQKTPKSVQKAAETVRNAARRITRERNKALDDAAMCVQHMGDNFNRMII